MDNATIIAIVSTIIAAAALIWAIYTHFSTRKIAKLTYDVSQLSDFGVPPSFLEDMPRSPIAITVTSRGNKGTENIILRLKTKSPIEEVETSPETLPVNHATNSLVIECARLNPSQQIQLFLKCAGAPTEDQIEELDISHSEGAAIDESEIQTISIDVAGIGFVYNTTDLTAKLSHIGPFSFASSKQG
jgi:hypothetical protein